MSCNIANRMKIVVGGVGLVSALGAGVDANVAAMREGRSGIALSPSYCAPATKYP